jgi:hypothetical protein
MKPETKAAVMIALLFILALLLLRKKQAVTVQNRQVTFAPEIKSINYNLGGYDYADLVYPGGDYTYNPIQSLYYAKGSCKCQ